MGRFEFDPDRLKVRILMNNKEADSPEFRRRVQNAMRQAGIETLALIRASKFMPKNLGTLRQSFIRKEKFTADLMEVIVSSPLVYAEVMEGGRKVGARLPPDKEIREWVISKGLLSQALTDEGDRRKFLKRAFSGSQFRTLRGTLGFKARTQSLSKFKARTSVGLLGKVIKASERAQERTGKEKEPLRAVNLNTAAITDVSRILDSMVFLIRRSIGAKGIEAHNFILRVFKVMVKRYRVLVINAVGR